MNILSVFHIYELRIYLLRESLMLFIVFSHFVKVHILKFFQCIHIVDRMRIAYIHSYKLFLFTVYQYLLRKIGCNGCLSHIYINIFCNTVFWLHFNILYTCACFHGKLFRLYIAMVVYRFSHTS